LLKPTTPGGDGGAGKFEDVPGFCKSAKVEEIRKNCYVLTPWRYVGAQVQ
jgi:type I restriction enzyme M protein